MDKSRILYDNLVADKLYTKSYEEFMSDYGTPDGQAELHSMMYEDKLYSKSLDDFRTQFFSISEPVKKKEASAPSLGGGLQGSSSGVQSVSPGLPGESVPVSEPSSGPVPGLKTGVARSAFKATTPLGVNTHTDFSREWWQTGDKTGDMLTELKGIREYVANTPLSTTVDEGIAMLESGDPKAKEKVTNYLATKWQEYADLTMGKEGLTPGPQDEMVLRRLEGLAEMGQSKSREEKAEAYKKAKEIADNKNLTALEIAELTGYKLPAGTDPSLVDFTPEGDFAERFRADVMAKAVADVADDPELSFALGMDDLVEKARGEGKNVWEYLNTTQFPRVEEWALSPEQRAQAGYQRKFENINAARDLIMRQDLPADRKEAALAQLDRDAGEYAKARDERADALTNRISRIDAAIAGNDDATMRDLWETYSGGMPYDRGRIAEQLSGLRREYQYERDGFFKNRDEMAEMVLSDNPDIMRHTGAVPPGTPAWKRLGYYYGTKVEQYDRLYNSVYGPEAARKPLYERIGERIQEIPLGQSEEKEMLDRLGQEIKTLTPVVMLNQSPKELQKREDPTSVFMRSAGNAALPLNIEGNTEKARAVEEALGVSGVSGEDITETAAGGLEEVSKAPETWSGENIAATLGTTAGLMIPFLVSEGMISPAFKGGGVLGKLGRLAKGEETLLGFAASKDMNFVPRMMTKLTNAVGRTLADATVQGIKYEVAGDIFKNAEDEANFLSGFYGGLASGLIPKGTKEAVTRTGKVFAGMFGEDAREVANIIISRGAGETAEETAQSVYQIYHDSKNGQDFYDKLSEQFGKPSDAAFFVLSTFIMGAAFNATEIAEGLRDHRGSGSYADMMTGESRAAYERLDARDRAYVDRALEANRMETEALHEDAVQVVKGSFDASETPAEAGKELTEAVAGMSPRAEPGVEASPAAREMLDRTWTEAVGGKVVLGGTEYDVTNEDGEITITDESGVSRPVGMETEVGTDKVSSFGVEGKTEARRVDTERLGDYMRIVEAKGDYTREKAREAFAEKHGESELSRLDEAVSQLPEGADVRSSLAESPAVTEPTAREIVEKARQEDKAEAAKRMRVFEGDGSEAELEGAMLTDTRKNVQEAGKLAANFVRSARGVAKGMKVVVHDSPLSFADEVERLGGTEADGEASGFYDEAGNAVHLNLATVTPTTLAHEIIHPVLVAAGKSNPEAVRSLAGKMAKLPGFDKAMEWARGREYGESTDTEAVVEYLASVARGEVKVDRPVLRRIWEALKEFAGRFIPAVARHMATIKTDGEIEAFVDGLARSMRRGREIRVAGEAKAQAGDTGGPPMSQRGDRFRSRVIADIEALLSSGRSEEEVSRFIQEEWNLTEQEARESVSSVARGETPRVTKRKIRESITPGKVASTPGMPEYITQEASKMTNEFIKEDQKGMVNERAAAILNAENPVAEWLRRAMNLITESKSFGVPGVRSDSRAMATAIALVDTLNKLPGDIDAETREEIAGAYTEVMQRLHEMVSTNARGLVFFKQLYALSPEWTIESMKADARKRLERHIEKNKQLKAELEKLQKEAERLAKLIEEARLSAELTPEERKLLREMRERKVLEKALADEGIAELTPEEKEVIKKYKLARQYDKAQKTSIEDAAKAEALKRIKKQIDEEAKRLMRELGFGKGGADPEAKTFMEKFIDLVNRASNAKIPLSDFAVLLSKRWNLPIVPTAAQLSELVKIGEKAKGATGIFANKLNEEFSIRAWLAFNTLNSGGKSVLTTLNNFAYNSYNSFWDAYYARMLSGITTQLQNGTAVLEMFGNELGAVIRKMAGQRGAKSAGFIQPILDFMNNMGLLFRAVPGASSMFKAVFAYGGADSKYETGELSSKLGRPSALDPRMMRTTENAKGIAGVLANLHRLYEKEGKSSLRYVGRALAALDISVRLMGFDREAHEALVGFYRRKGMNAKDARAAAVRALGRSETDRASAQAQAKNEMDYLISLDAATLPRALRVMVSEAKGRQTWIDARTEEILRELTAQRLRDIVKSEETTQSFGNLLRGLTYTEDRGGVFSLIAHIIGATKQLSAAFEEKSKKEGYGAPAKALALGLKATTNYVLPFVGVVARILDRMLDFIPFIGVLRLNGLGVTGTMERIGAASEIGKAGFMAHPGQVGGHTFKPGTPEYDRLLERIYAGGMLMILIGAMMVAAGDDDDDKAKMNGLLQVFKSIPGLAGPTMFMEAIYKTSRRPEFQGTDDDIDAWGWAMALAHTGGSFLEGVTEQSFLKGVQTQLEIYRTAETSADYFKRLGFDALGAFAMGVLPTKLNAFQQLLRVLEGGTMYNSREEFTSFMAALGLNHEMFGWNPFTDMSPKYGVFGEERRSWPGGKSFVIPLDYLTSNIDPRYERLASIGVNIRKDLPQFGMSTEDLMTEDGVYAWTDEDFSAMQKMAGERFADWYSKYSASKEFPADVKATRTLASGPTTVAIYNIQNEWKKIKAAVKKEYKGSLGVEALTPKEIISGKDNDEGTGGGFGGGFGGFGSGGFKGGF